MTALTGDKNIPERMGANRVGAVAANAQVYSGALLMRNAAGFLKPGATEIGAVGVGRAEGGVDNSGGADGAETVPFKSGVFRYMNSGDRRSICQSTMSIRLTKISLLIEVLSPPRAGSKNWSHAKMGFGGVSSRLRKQLK